MSKEFNITVLPGDGIGPEVIAEAIKVLRVVEQKLGLSLKLEECPVGGAAYEQEGHPLPENTLKKAESADAVLLGAVGGPKWETIDFSLRPERALLGLRSSLGLFANLRPAKIFGALSTASSLKPEVVEGLDIMVVRELTGGIYFGEPRGIETTPSGERKGINTLVYTESEIKRIAAIAFDVAKKRDKKVCSIDKANVLECTGLWRDVVTEVHKDHPEIELSHMYVDNAAMQLVRNPNQFDVMVTTNMFGDILSDEASMLTGSIGMLPSASLGEKHAMYEPIHGSAPDIAGQDKANPLATIMSVGMMFKYSFNREDVHDSLEKVVESVLDADYRTPDIMSDGMKQVGCKEMGDLVAKGVEGEFRVKKKDSYEVAVVGATGAVGRAMLSILEERDFPVANLTCLASARSAGSKLPFKGGEVEVRELKEDSFKGLDIALFSAGGSISKQYGPIAVNSGCVVIDNSSAWRMDPQVPLVVPEINASAIGDDPGIIANPNCSTIQMVMALKPIHDLYKIRRVVVSTYQSVSGSGQKAIEELSSQTQRMLNGGEANPEVYPHQIAFNCLPHIDVFTDNGYTKEEMKMVNETRKIMEDDSIDVSPTTVRVPVMVAHSESVNVECERELDLAKVRESLASFPGVKVVDAPGKNEYPLASDAAGKDEVQVGRIRIDLGNPRVLNFWVVADNLRKGAALNAVQIAEKLIGR